MMKGNQGSSGSLMTCHEGAEGKLSVGSGRKPAAHAHAAAAVPPHAAARRLPRPGDDETTIVHSGSPGRARERARDELAIWLAGWSSPPPPRRPRRAARRLLAAAIMR